MRWSVEQARARAFAWRVGLCLAGPCVAGLCLATPATVYAQPGGSPQDVQAAAAAFAEGQRAQLRGDYARAAELFEVADQAAPSPQALRSAIRNHRQAGQQARAATLAARALEQYPEDAETAALAREVLDATEAVLGHLVVTCAPACSLSVGGRAGAPRPVSRLELYAEPGAAEVVASWPDRPERTASIALEPGQRAELALTPPEPEPIAAPEPEPVAEPEPEPVTDPEPEPAPRPADEGGLHPAFALVGAGLTAVGAAVTIWSAVDTLDARDAYVANPTQAGYEDGVGREWRTNGLLIGTAVVAVASVVLGLFTDWDGDATSVAVGVSPEGGMATLRVPLDRPLARPLARQAPR